MRICPNQCIETRLQELLDSNPKALKLVQEAELIIAAYEQAYELYVQALIAMGIIPTYHTTTGDSTEAVLCV